MTNLNLYNISDEYVEYLQREEKKSRGFTKVSNNNDILYSNKRPYVGIILEINSFKYFVPLTHPKAHYSANRKFFDRISMPINLKNGRDYGRIMFCYMIPVSDCDLPDPIKINDIADKKYKSVLMTQYFYINSCGKSKIINLKARDLYQKVINENHYLHPYCCDFHVLEEACRKRMLARVEV